MSRGIILYQSKYGATKKYANIISAAMFAFIHYPR